MKFILGLLLIGGGTAIIIYTEWMMQNFGRIDWFEEKFGPEGGSRMGYKIIGLIFIFAGMLLVTGLGNSFLLWLLSPLINRGAV